MYMVSQLHLIQHQWLLAPSSSPSINDSLKHSLSLGLLTLPLGAHALQSTCTLHLKVVSEWQLPVGKSWCSVKDALGTSAVRGCGPMAAGGRQRWPYERDDAC